MALIAIGILDHPQLSYGKNYQAMLENSLPAKDRWFGIRITHPYFGFVRETSDPRANNMGFLDVHNYPYLKSSNQFVVGIFGGSVAMLFGANAESKQILGQALQNKFPGLRKKEIVILNFAVGGSKQPQSFFIFSYFQKYLDMALNLDGFNEIAVTVGAGYPADYPLDSKYYFRNNARDMAIFGRLELARTFLRSVTRVPIAIPPLRYSQVYYLFSSQLYSITARWAANLTKSLREIPQSAAGETSSESIRKRVEIWRRYTEMESDLGRAFGKTNLFFIQPNQYVAGTKKLSPEELQIAYSGPNTLLSDGMKAIVSELPGLNRKHVFAWSLLDAFKSEKESIYVDDCCHYNPRGNVLLARAIADIISNAKFSLRAR